MKSKLIILFAAGALMLAMAATAAFADNLLCQVGIACNGTPKGDLLTGTTSSDQIKGFGGKDRINDNLGNDIDTIAGGAKNDTIDVQEGNSSTNNRDLVDCGKGTRDRVFFDTGSNGDRVVRCEIKSPWSDDLAGGFEGSQPRITGIRLSGRAGPVGSAPQRSIDALDELRGVGAVAHAEQLVGGAQVLLHG